MFDYFFAGGPLFMTLLTLLALAALIVAGRQVGVVWQAEVVTPVHASGIDLVLHLGLFSFFLGILAQSIALMEALQAIETRGNVSPATLMAGLRVSMIAPVYGLLILLVSFALWAVLRHQWKARVAG